MNFGSRLTALRQNFDALLWKARIWADALTSLSTGVTCSRTC